MSFEIARFVRHTDAFNAGQISVVENPSGDTVTLNGPAMFSYASATDTIAAIGGANYFAEVVYDLAVNDWIICTGSDASAYYQVATIDREAGTITTASGFPSGVIGTVNIDDGAVTTPKLDDAAVTSAKTSPLLIQNVQVDVDLATFIGSYTASVELVPAPGANQKIILHRATLWINYGGTVLANGGAMHIQYDDSANGAGTKATGTLAAATLISATADTTFGFTPVDTTLVDSTTLNTGLYLATATADFTGGTSSAYKVDLWYSVIDVS